MSSKEQELKVIRFKRRKELNIGIIIFGIIFIYLVATVIMYITAPRVTVYEVREGSILKDYSYTGIAIREELVVHSNASGYINYYAPESSKVRVGSDIYTLSNDALQFDESITEDSNTLTTEEEYAIMMQIQDFNQDYQDSTFSDCYHLKTNIQNTLTSHSSQNKLSQLQQMVNSGNASGISIYKTSDDGVVVYSVDGMEELTKDTVTAEHLKQSNYKTSEFTNNSKITSGDAVYKIITDDVWYLMIELSKETASSLQETKSVKVNFTKDDQSMRAGFELIEKDGHYLGFLKFQDSMVRYATERYLDIELILEDETGLKIPKSAETEKDFYVVPKSYITQGGNSSSDGVLVKSKDQDGNDVTVFTTVDIYYEDKEIVYLDPADFENNKLIVKPDSLETYELQEKRSLKGVYCINKGYAVFKQINILCESDTYYIVEEGNRYGLANYDHIALDSTNIKENDVVF